MNVTTAQVDHPDLLTLLVKCCDSLQRYSSFTPRESVSSFCNITSKGCNKFREECDFAGKHGTVEESGGEIRLDPLHNCWLANGSGWCSDYKSPWGSSIDSNTKCSFPNPELCRVHGGPCPCYGCVTPHDISETIVPKDVSQSLGYLDSATWADVLNAEPAEDHKEYIQEEAKRHLCPYNQLELGGETTSFAQCYLTRKEFRRLQTRSLQLYTGLYAFYDPFPEIGAATLIYCLQDPRGTIQFPFYVYDGKSAVAKTHWRHDSDMKYKQFVAKEMRQAEAQFREQEADFYKILNNPTSEQLTPFEKELGVLYAPDGELSAFILGCVMRMTPNILTKLPSRSDRWSYRLAFDIPNYVQTLLEKLRVAYPQRTQIVPTEATLLELFDMFGLIDPTGVKPTERLVLLVEWLIDVIGKPEIYDSLFGDGWIKIAPTRKDEILGKLNNTLRQFRNKPNNRVTIANILPLLEVLLSNRDLDAAAFGKHSRVGYENLFAHLAWRAYSPAARGWIVVPLHAHPFSENGQVQFRYIAFFLGTFKDTDDNGRALQSEELRDRISAIRLVANSAARDYEYLFLAEVLQGHIDQLLSTPGPRFAHDIQPWLADLLNPALDALKALKEKLHNSDNSDSAVSVQRENLSKQSPQVIADVAAKLELLKRQLMRLDSVVTAVMGKRKLGRDELGLRAWGTIESNIKTEARTGPDDTITFGFNAVDDSFCGDTPILELIILRLVANSLQHRGDNEFAEVKIQIEQDAELMQIIVTDGGKGYNLVVERGRRRPSILRKGGMGWSLVQIEQLAKLHKGRIEYDNVVGSDGEVKGAQTTVTLRSTR